MQEALPGTSFADAFVASATGPINATVTTSNTGRPSTSSGRDSPAKALLRKTIVMME